MSSRNIAVQEAVYDALVREKRPGESFTVLFRRLLNQREGLEELWGAWAPEKRRRAGLAPGSSAASRRGTP